MKSFIAVVVLFASIFCHAQAALADRADHRPAFDKSAYKHTLWSQVNPWWTPNKPRQFYPLGGPNYARKVYPDAPVDYWKEAMVESQKHGMTGWQFELVAPTPGYGHTFKNAVLPAAEALGNEFKLSIFLSTGTGSAQEGLEQLIRQFAIFEEEWKNHPAIFRVDGCPVIVIYTPFRFTAEQWGEIIPGFEARFGKAIWLMNIWHKTYDVASKPAQVREYLPYFDGISAYANWTQKAQGELYRTLAPIMRDEFPQKIFEGSVHNTYAAHYHYGGVATYLSEKYRDSWDSMHEADVDSVVMTNFFDHWENSLVLPCYERENFLLRYAQYEMARRRGESFQAWSQPELVLTSYIDLIAGRRPLRFEIIAFPIQGSDRQMELTVEVCDTAGRPLHRFPLQPVTLDKLQTLEFELPADLLLDQRAVVPRIVGKWKGEDWSGDFNPPTLLSPSMRTSWMFWARSTRNRVVTVDGNLQWQLNGVAPGHDVTWRDHDGFGVVRSSIKPRQSPPVKLIRVMRNNMEWLSLPGQSLDMARALTLPHPGQTLDYYWLEMETAAGHRTQTLPIWVSTGSRSDTVNLPLFLADGRIVQRPIEAARVPYFHYPTDMDTGELLLDVSGHQHHGRLQRQGKVSYAYGSLLATGYRHYHNGRTSGDDNPHFRRDEDGRGYLSFDAADEDFYMISGGTAFPYASTFELEFRTKPQGRMMYLLGTANNQIALRINENGILQAIRGTEQEGAGGDTPARRSIVTLESRQPIKADTWHHVAVVYDLRTVRLYLDGQLQASQPIAPTRGHESINHVTLGSGCGFLHRPHDYLTGDLRNIRFYGRNLSRQEFLKAPGR